MAVLSFLFLCLAVVCGVLAFGADEGAAMIWHVGFIVGVVGFVSFAVVMLARSAVASLDDVPGRRVR